MSDLEDYRDYADQIARGDHEPDCRGGTTEIDTYLAAPQEEPLW